MTALIIIGCVLLLFIILFSVRVLVTIDLTDELALTVRIFGIPIRILPKKQKKYKLRHYTLKKIRKRDTVAARKKAKSDAKKAAKKAKKLQQKREKADADAKLTKEELKARRAAEKAKKPKLTDLIPLVARVVGLFFSRFFGKLHIKVARIHVKVAAGDAMTAAVLFGIVNQSVQYLLTVLGRVSHVDGLKKADISVQPDFLTSSLAFDCKLTFGVSLGAVLGALLKAGIAFLRGYIRIKPDTAPPSPDSQPDKALSPDIPPSPDAPFIPDTPD